jgi:gamma-glutamyltranspeptidase/glutathione hydrolase/leukotriene-C4 hydrolase
MVVRIPPYSESIPQNTTTTTESKPSEVWTINFREVAPALSNRTMYKDNPMGSRIGGLAVGVPGEIRGLQEAHSRWGSKPWKELVEPSVKLATGWKVQRELARRIRVRGLPV